MTGRFSAAEDAEVTDPRTRPTQTFKRPASFSSVSRAKTDQRRDSFDYREHC